jgi:hypothetical protein
MRDATNAETRAAAANTRCDRSMVTTSLSERSTIAKPDAVLTGTFLGKGLVGSTDREMPCKGQWQKGAG